MFAQSANNIGIHSHYRMNGKRKQINVVAEKNNRTLSLEMQKKILRFKVIL